MTPREAMGMVCVVSGLGTELVAWVLQEFWWSVGGAPMLVAGFLLIWTRERQERAKQAAAELFGQRPAWFGPDD